MTHWLQDSTLSLQHSGAVSEVYNELKHWLRRFPQGDNNRLFDHFSLLFLSATKEFLNHREPHHLSKLILSLVFLEQKLQRLATQFPENRHIEFKIFPATLFYPFSSKKTLGCLVGAYLPDTYDRLDEQSLVGALQKILGPLQLISESVYRHPTKNKNLHLLYIELEKQRTSLLERKKIQTHLKENLLRTIPKLFPTVFMRRNQEEAFKNILLLSQEIDSPSDLPQVMLSLEEQTQDEIIFLITLVTVEKNLSFDPAFIVERNQIVRILPTGESLRAYLMRLPLHRDPQLFRSDGSLNFYSAREKASHKLQEAVGEFRDYNGGLLLKQGELLQSLKEAFPKIASNDPELIENFFYSLSPLEKQATLSKTSLQHFFYFFLEATRLPPPNDYILRSQEFHHLFFISLQSSSLSLKDALSPLTFSDKEVIFSSLTIGQTFYFTCMLSDSTEDDQQTIRQLMRDTVQAWHQNTTQEKVVRICLENNVSSLDPRIGGDDATPAILKMLFEGLMRLNSKGQIEPAIAEKVTVSEDGKKYTFHLRTSYWNDGSPLTAHDFEYAWKTLLSPSFETVYDYFFHPILNAKEAKLNRIPMSHVGIHALNDHTLEVHLAFPAPYFLQLTAHPLYSPIHRIKDERSPDWPSLTGRSFPCNGPFELKVNHPNNGYHLTKNPLYWDPHHISVDKFIFTRAPSHQIPELFQKNEIDLISLPFVSSNATYPDQIQSKTTYAPHNLISWCVFNTRLAPFSSAQTRNTLASAIDKSTFTSLIPLPITPAHSPLHACHTQLDPYPAPFSSNASLPPKIQILFHASKGQEILAKALQKNWQDTFGIECELKPLLWTNFFHQIIQGNFQVCLMSWVSWIDDPIYTLNAFRSSLEKINFPRWENPSFVALLEKADQEIDTQKRLQYLAQAEQILVQEMPVIPLYYQSCRAMARSNLELSYHPFYGYFNLLRTVQPKENKYEQ